MTQITAELKTVTKPHVDLDRAVTITVPLWFRAARIIVAAKET